MVQQDAAYDWETNATWYDPSRHDVRFIVTPTLQDQPGFTAAIYKYFGRPALPTGRRAYWSRSAGAEGDIPRPGRWSPRFVAARAISQPGQREPVDFPVRSWYAFSRPG